MANSLDVAASQSWILGCDGNCVIFHVKISGFHKPSKANEASFLTAVEEIAGVSARLPHSLETGVPPKNREVETAKLKARAKTRFGG